MADDYDDDGDYDPAEDAGPDELNDLDEEDEKGSQVEDEEDKEEEAELSGEESEAEDEGDAVETEEKGDAEDDDEQDVLVQVRSAAKTRVDPIVKISNAHRKIIVVPDDDRVTSNILQPLEAARVDSVRAKQMESSPTIFVDASGIHDSVLRARKEREAGRCPLVLRRRVGWGAGGEIIVEDWKVREMVQPPLN